MEATGRYGLDLAKFLHEQEHAVSIIGLTRANDAMSVLHLVNYRQQGPGFLFYRLAAPCAAPGNAYE